MNSEKTILPPKTLVSLGWISLLGTLVILAVKVMAYLQTHSDGVLSDTLESLVDVVSAIATIFVMRAVAEPADQEHPYGHGKLEYFSAAFEGGMITFAALLIAYGAIRALLFGHQVAEIESGLGLMILSVILNISFAAFLYQRGKSAGSPAILAKAKHVLIDIVTTLAVIVGLGLVKLTGLVWIDSVAALFVALHLVREGSHIVRESVGALIDEVDVTALKGLAKAFSEHRKPGIIDIHQMKLIRSGRFHHVDVHLVMPEFWDILHAHQVADELEKKVMASYFYDGEVAFHVDPCLQEYCSSCELPDCPIRKQKFIARREFTPESISKPPNKDELK